MTIPPPSCEPLGQDPSQGAGNSLAAIDALSDLLDVARNEGSGRVSRRPFIVVVEKQHFFRRGSVFVGLSGRGLIKIISVYLTRHRPGQQYGLSETGRRVRRADGVANSRKRSRGRVLCYIN